MAKISRHGGPSDRTDVALALTADEAVAVVVDALSSALFSVAGDPGPDAQGEAAAEHIPVSVYDGWLRAQLQDECERRGLARAGNKDELVARLVADDAG